MANRAWARLHPGGTVQRAVLETWLQKHFQMSVEEFLERGDEGDQDGIPYFDGDYLVMEDGAATGGMFSAEEDGLREAGIAYNRAADGSGSEWPASFLQWRPGMTAAIENVTDGDSTEWLVSASTVREKLAEGGATLLTQWLDDECPIIPELGKLEIID